MSYRATVFKVMIAYPSDVREEEEIDIIYKALTKWNIANLDSRKQFLFPTRWTHIPPTMGDRPQSIINKNILDECDLLIAILWTRVGTPTGDYEGGTIEEIEKQLAKNKPTMLYFAEKDLPYNSNIEQLDKVEKFKKSCQLRGLCYTYKNLNDFREHFREDLDRKMNEEIFRSKGNTNKESGTAEESTPKMPQLTHEAQVLLYKSAKSDGEIIYTSDSSGTSFEIKDNTIISSKDNKILAPWIYALNLLKYNGLIKQTDSRGEIFTVRHLGYEVVKVLESTIPQLSKEARILIKEASLSSNGEVLHFKFAGGESITVHEMSIDTNYSDDKTINKLKPWERALDELLEYSFIEELNYEGNSYKITIKGYEIADFIEL